MNTVLLNLISQRCSTMAESSAAGNDEESIKTLLMIMKNCRDVIGDLENLQKEYLVPDKSARFFSQKVED